MDQTIRPFDYDKDLDAVKRIWREVGWTTSATETGIDDFFAVGETIVATMDGVPECSVHILDGTMRVQETDLPLCAVMAVTTSRIARSAGFAKKLTALQLARGAEQGAALAALGMFDQGFYDQLGFGTGSYAHRFTIDPSSLDVPHRVPAPVRLTKDDYADMHAAMAGRHKVHGSVVLHQPRLIRGELGFDEDGFGLGYRADDGRLSHFVWLTGSGERGPYEVRWLGYENGAQLIELLGLMKSFADQIYSLRMVEPPEIQLQSLLRRPFRTLGATAKGNHANQHESMAYWQARIMDLPACVAGLHLPGVDLDFSVRVSDPVDGVLPDDVSWRGIGGEYVVHLGETSHAQRGRDDQLPELQCSVNALTRLLLGIRPASSLALTDDFAGPADLLVELDDSIRLPDAIPGWDF